MSPGAESGSSWVCGRDTLIMCLYRPLPATVLVLTLLHWPSRQGGLSFYETFAQGLLSYDRFTTTGPVPYIDNPHDTSSDNDQHIGSFKFTIEHQFPNIYSYKIWLAQQLVIKKLFTIYQQNCDKLKTMPPLLVVQQWAGISNKTDSQVLSVSLNGRDLYPAIMYK